MCLQAALVKTVEIPTDIKPIYMPGAVDTSDTVVGIPVYTVATVAPPVLLVATVVVGETMVHVIHPEEGHRWVILQKEAPYS